MNGFTGIDILFAGANGDVTVGEHFFDGVIGFFGISEVVDKASAEYPVAVVECMDSDACNVRIDATGFGHEFVAGVVDLLDSFYKSMEVAKDLICTSFIKD